MKKILTLLIVLILGLGIGGGAAFGVSRYLGPPTAKSEHVAEKEKVETAFLPTGALTAPVVTTDGNLSGYVSFEIQLEVAEADEAETAAHLPLLLHAINLRTFHTPLAAGPQMVLPDVAAFSKVVMDAAAESLGKGKVLRAVVTKVQPL